MERGSRRVRDNGTGMEAGEGMRKLVCFFVSEAPRRKPYTGLFCGPSSSPFEFLRQQQEIRGNNLIKVRNYNMDSRTYDAETFHVIFDDGETTKTDGESK